jgi:amidase
MRMFAVCSSVVCSVPLLILAPQVQPQTRTAESLTGEWQLTSVEMEIPYTERLQLASSGENITGQIYRSGKSVPVKGTVKAGEIHLEFQDGKETDTYDGKLTEAGMSGNYSVKGESETTTGTWSAKRAPTDKPASPRTLDFTPTNFYRQLSADTKPVLRIWPGDTVHTTSVDAGGQDEKGARRVVGGNPLTGPFYVEGAMPGDVVAITIKRLRINRDWAMSDSGLVDRALTINYASENKQEWKDTRWHLDADKQTATLENPPEHLKNFTVQLRPMLGCVGVAPNPWRAPVQTQDSGSLGGNMDFNGVAEGATIFLNVQQPGALLYLGDAHAVQGDGELNGNALETSMDIVFTVDVQPEKHIGTPRVENADYLMAMGLSGTLDDAFREATSELAAWLQTDYKLTGAEVASVLGTSIEYKISEVADRNVGVVAKIRKSSLSSLAAPK